MNHEVEAFDENGELQKGKKFRIAYSDGTTKTVTSNSDGIIKLQDCVPGVIIEFESNERVSGLIKREK